MKTSHFVLLVSSLIGSASFATQKYSNPGDAKVGAAWSLRRAKGLELERTMPTLKLSLVAEAGPHLIFASYEPASVKTGEDTFYTFRPAIVRKASKSMPTNFIALDAFARYGWVGAASLPSKGLYWGVLDYQVEGTAHALPLIWSKDGGRKWSFLALVEKRHFADTFKSFGMDENGNGQLAIDSNDDLGFYVLETKDFGKTWSAPRIFTSVTSRGNEVPEDCFFGQAPVKKIDDKCALPAQLRK